MISLAHLHTSTVSVREQAALVVDRLRRAGHADVPGAGRPTPPDRVTTVARFLALLELFREQAVAFEQLTPLGELTIRWTGSASGDLEISDEFDEDARRHRPSCRTVVAGATTEADDSAEGTSMSEQSEQTPSRQTRWWPAPPTLTRRRGRGHRRAGGAAADRRRADAGDRAGGGRWVPRRVVVADALAELVAFYDETGRGFELRADRRRLALLHPRGARRPGQPLPAGRTAGQAVPGGAGDPGRGGVPAADLAGPDLRGPRGERRRRDADAADPRSGRARPVTTTSPGRSCSRTTGYFLERMGLRGLDDLPALAPHLPEVDELEAELSQLARPQAVPDEPSAEPAARHAEEPDHERENTHG